MKVTLFPPELRVFTRAVNSLGKLGDELYFECCSDKLSLRCVNSSRSAFAVSFFSDIFFNRACGLADFDNTPYFKLTSRTCCKVFKLSLTWDKFVQKCKLQLEKDSNLLFVQFFQRHGIIKTYNLPIIDCESLEAVYDINKATNTLSISSKVLAEIFNNFRANQNEVTMILRDGECIFRNYIDDADFTAIVTHVPVASSEFKTYNLHEESEITFCQKDLRAAISFGESANSSVSLNFSQPGKPLILTFDDDSRFKAHFVLATLPNLDETRSVDLERSSENCTTSKSFQFTPSSRRLKENNFFTECPKNCADTEMAPTQIVPFAATQEMLNPPTRPVCATAMMPLTVRSENVSDPPIKKARSVLFSRHLPERLFGLAPPAESATVLDAWDSDDETENEDKFVAGGMTNYSGDGLSGPITSCRKFSTTSAATAGWSICDQTTRVALHTSARTANSTTLLVPDSDEET